MVELKVMKEELISKIQRKEAIIGVIGLGYVGLPLALAFSEAKFKVVGFDVDENKLKRFEAGESCFKHISSVRVETAVSSGTQFTSDFSKVAALDAILICLPTPLNKNREPDLSHVTQTLDNILPHIRQGQVLSLESTTYPGTTEEEIVSRIHANGLETGKNFFVVYSPEREDPGNKSYSMSQIPKVVGGFTDACGEVGVALYQGSFEKVHAVSSSKTAEMTKLLENIHRSVNIGLVNELKMVADKMGVDIYEVIEAAATKPFGFTPFYPGPGLGGHCIPIDPFYLTWKAREYGLTTRFIELAGEVNSKMPAWVVEKVVGALNEQGKAVLNSKILVVGVAYKKNIDDMRESPSIEIIRMLLERRAIVEFSDLWVPCVQKPGLGDLNSESQNITADNLATYDCVLIATDHDDVDYQFIQAHSCCVVDARGVLRKNGFSNVVSA